jgi:DNA-binding response OmpR family regulator
MVSSRAQAPRKVLIVDQSSECREVLRTVLQRRGLDIYEADAGEQGLDIAKACRPDLVVLDLDTVGSENNAVFDGFDTQAREGSSVLVLLGGIRQCGNTRKNSDLIAKPYHYGPLVRKIEELLSQAAANGNGST